MNAIGYGESAIKDAGRLEWAGNSARGERRARDQGEAVVDRRASFWDKIAGKYSRRPIADEAAYRKKLEITRTYFRPDMEVLELGCGTGSTAIEHALWVKHIRATDISSNMLEIARGKAEAKGVRNITFERAAVDDLQIPDGSVDVVLALSLLHLLDDHKEVVAKVHRMLKPGGAFVTSTACLGDAMNWFKPIAAVGRLLGLIPLVRFLSSEGLRSDLVRAGLDIDHQWQPGKNKAVFMVARKPRLEARN